MKKILGKTYLLSNKLEVEIKRNPSHYYCTELFLKDQTEKDTVLNLNLSNNVKIEIITKFYYIGETKDLKIPIYSFGYFAVPKSLTNDFYYEEPNGFDINTGKSIQKYIKEKEVKELIFKYVKKNLKKLLKKINPPILIRGVMNDFKNQNKRYKEIDEIISSYYDKNIVNIEKYVGKRRELNDFEWKLYKYFDFVWDKSDKEILVYTKKLECKKEKEVLNKEMFSNDIHIVK